MTTELIGREPDHCVGITFRVRNDGITGAGFSFDVTVEECRLYIQRALRMYNKGLHVCHKCNLDICNSDRAYAMNIMYLRQSCLYTITTALYCSSGHIAAGLQTAA